MSGILHAPPTSSAFRAARAVEHAKLTCGPNRHLTLNDVRGMKMQAQDVVAAFQSLLADSGLSLAPAGVRGQPRRWRAAS